MKWYKKLYLGDNAEKSKLRIMAMTVARRFQPEVYLITLSQNPDNILEMFQANVFIQPYFKKEESRKDLLIIGIAKGYDEGLEVMAKILGETYDVNGNFNVKAHLGIGDKK